MDALEEISALINTALSNRQALTAREMKRQEKRKQED
jgi:hypothetical protein